jgi:glycosyltransferase involved in cell wall biosynthesis
MKKLLIIASVFPEPSTTAAGLRMLDLIQFFLEQEYQILLVSAASLSARSAPLEALNIQMKSIVLNDASFDVLLKEFQPNIVLFDRFVMEEQYGWRVSEILPNALKILDTEDLHFLRKARQAAYNAKVAFTEEMLYSEEAKRELASLLRCDLSLIISSYEMELLKREFKIPEELLLYLPLLVEENTKQKTFPSFEERKHFVTAGNFYHAPNLDAVLRLKRGIWPFIRKELPQAEIHIYGAYAPEQVLQMHKPTEGFFVDGWVEDLEAVLQNAKICLTPLSFGAGLKGKLLQSMLNGTPIVTTNIGAEAMYGNYQVPGIIANDNDSIVQAAIKLYTQKARWESCLIDIPNILSDLYNKKKFLKEFSDRLEFLVENLNAHRKTHFITQIIQYHDLLSRKYMSKWIVEKKRNEGK